MRFWHPELPGDISFDLVQHFLNLQFLNLYSLPRWHTLCYFHVYSYSACQKGPNLSLSFPGPTGLWDFRILYRLYLTFTRDSRSLTSDSLWSICAPGQVFPHIRLSPLNRSLGVGNVADTPTRILYCLWVGQHRVLLHSWYISSLMLRPVCPYWLVV